MTASTPVAFEDPQYREAVIDLLGVIAYGEISAFERLAEDAKLAPTLEDKVAIVSMATAEFAHVARLNERLTELGADHYTRRINPDTQKRSHIRHLEALGYTVTLTPAA